MDDDGDDDDVLSVWLIKRVRVAVMDAVQDAEPVPSNKYDESAPCHCDQEGGAGEVREVQIEE